MVENGGHKVVVIMAKSSEAVLSTLLASLDALSTYANFAKYETCEIELNPIVRSLCEKVGPSGAFVWVPVEATAIYLSDQLVKFIARQIGSPYTGERILDLIFLIPSINNFLRLVGV
jgi:hypothetical protein